MQTIGAFASEHIAVGLVEDHHLVGDFRVFPAAGSKSDYLESLHTEEIVQQLAEQIEAAAQGHEIEAIGIGFPGIIRDGIVQDSPNLSQTKGQDLRGGISALLAAKGIAARVHVLND